MFQRFAPTSLFVRFFLIIVLPIVFAQIIATYIFYNRHWFSVSKNMAHSLANDIQIMLYLDDHEIPNIQKNKLFEDLRIQISKRKYNKKTAIKDHFDEDAEFLYHALKKKFSVPIRVRFADKNNSIKAEIFRNGTSYTFTTDSKRVDNPTTYIFILWMTGASLIFLLLSVVFARNQIRPIIKLARAADRFGKGHHTVYLKPEGAMEIRKASMAFLKMKERIERQISHRTEMLAGVSHDLRTPLTRMKLQLALSKDSELESMLEDLKDMENMINSYIDFARGDAKELNKTIIFSKFVEKAVLPYANQAIQVTQVPNVKISLKTEAIKRCFQNLLDNGFKYATQVVINSYLDGNELIIDIHDNGPGIPKDRYEDVFKPFFRLEESRNKYTGGTGLGLAITKDVINNHGGEIKLGTSEILGGLKVSITLPL